MKNFLSTNFLKKMIHLKKLICILNAIYKEQKKNLVWFQSKIKGFLKISSFENLANKDIFVEMKSISKSFFSKSSISNRKIQFYFKNIFLKNQENSRIYTSYLKFNKNKQNSKILNIESKKLFLSDYKNHSRIIPPFSDKEQNENFVGNQKIYMSKSKQNKKNSIETRTSGQNPRFMDVLSSPKQPSVSITYEEIGLFPRSFNRVFDRFFKQLFFDVENLVIQEYRFYRYLFLTTVKCVFILIFVPFLVNFICKNYLVKPITEYYWNSAQPEIFLNSYQQKRAFLELKDFEEKIYFESLIDKAPNSISPYFSSVKTSKTSDENRRFSTEFTAGDSSFENKNEYGSSQISVLSKNSNQKSKISKEVFYPINFQSSMSFKTKDFKFVNQRDIEPIAFSNSLFEKSSRIDRLTYEMNELDTSYNFMNIASFNRKEYKLDEYIQKRIQSQIQQKTLELAIHYNEESIESITNFFADLISFSTLCFLLKTLEIQINITKSFLLEVFFGLDDSKKSLLILFVTDLLVGYHSPNIWELFFQSLFDHYGLPESQTTIFLLVATLPVLLDVLFKYLIFRHLNRASPATVATYHAMIE